MEEQEGHYYSWKSTSRTQVGEHVSRLFLPGELQPWDRISSNAVRVSTRRLHGRHPHPTGNHVRELDPLFVGVRDHGKGTGPVMIRVLRIP